MALSIFNCRSAFQGTRCKHGRSDRRIGPSDSTKMQRSNSPISTIIWRCLEFYRIPTCGNKVRERSKCLITGVGTQLAGVSGPSPPRCTIRAGRERAHGSLDDESVRYVRRVHRWRGSAGLGNPQRATGQAQAIRIRLPRSTRVRRRPVWDLDAQLGRKFPRAEH